MRMCQAWYGDGGRWLVAAALLCSFFLREVAAQAPAPPVLLTLDSPLQWQVFQRHSPQAGRVEVRGRTQQADQVEARWVGTAQPAPAWQRVPLAADGTFAATVEVPAGGWYRCEVRALREGQRLAEAAVGQVGVGEVFVVAGQSNSANYGEQKLQPASGAVASCNGQSWQEATDPQPGAEGGGGSFLPPLGDALSARFGVPIGFIACGIGATSVREWLPAETQFSHPPTLTGHVRQLPDGRWESDGAAFCMLVERMNQSGPGGFRAVLWHQGESDANQTDASRTLPGPLYQEYLTEIIRQSRQRMGREIPWFVAQATYHVPGDEASPDIRAAQAAVAADGTALSGPDSDSLKGEWREAGGKGVHFSGPGLEQHAKLWLEKIAPWLEEQLKQ